jgi:hypothetical protein
VLLVASSGGHLLELDQLRDCWPRHDRVWVTFATPDASALLEGEDVLYAYFPTNRSIRNLLRNLVLAARVIALMRPRAVVTTGAGVAIPFCYVARVFGARIVFIESFARVTTPSLTARLVHPISAAFFVQWPELVPSFRKARYVGSVFSLLPKGFAVEVAHAGLEDAGREPLDGSLLRRSA